uniref:CSON002119 protein n=1 Tax=Culicoides sonorensis TaxID=179676 RepID=A0A336KBV3_CULSO
MFKNVNCCSKTAICIWITLTLIVIGVGVTLGIVFYPSSDDEIFGNAAVVANGLECAKIGTDILRKNGSAVDAAIVTLLCEGIACPQSMGLGGGFIMVIYSKDKGTVETVNAREVAPLAAYEEMFVNDTTGASSEGGLSVAVPGELKGYYEIHKKYGKLPWSSLFEPAIKLCKEGIVVSPHLGKILKELESKILKEPSMKEIFIDPKTNQTWKTGDRIKRYKLAETFEIIAKEGADALYSKNGSLIKDFVQDIKNANGIITEEDLTGYELEWNTPDVSKLQDGSTLYVHPLPGSGSILTFMLNILSGYKIEKHDPVTMHRIIESFKYGYARRTNLGDRNFVPGIEELLSNLTSPDYASYIRSLIKDNQTFNDYEHYGANFSSVDDHGTAHISVLHENGDAVAVTSTINLNFGAGFRSPSTGIILNDEMDDFSTPGTVNAFGVPASPANYIVPKKRPMSSMVPTIIVDKNGNPRLIIGAAGGTRITTSVTLIILSNLFMNESLYDSIHAPRVHHQLAPMQIEHEDGYDKEILKELEKFQHKVIKEESESTYAGVTAIAREQNGKLSAVYDPRRGGSASII